ncbi:hypothetical protein HaLaN_02172, partial [Haematococcus lacustris]
MPAQASADTPQLLTIDCSTGGVGRQSRGKLLIDIARNAENVRLSLASHPGKGTPIHKVVCCELNLAYAPKGATHQRPWEAPGSHNPGEMGVAAAEGSNGGAGAAGAPTAGWSEAQ